jgi:hypothetical protein
MFRPDLLAGNRILITGGGLSGDTGRRFFELGAGFALCGRRCGRYQRGGGDDRLWRVVEGRPVQLPAGHVEPSGLAGAPAEKIALGTRCDLPAGGGTEPVAWLGSEVGIGLGRCEPLSPAWPINQLRIGSTHRSAPSRWSMAHDRFCWSRPESLAQGRRSPKSVS